MGDVYQGAWDSLSGKNRRRERQAEQDAARARQAAEQQAAAQQASARRASAPGQSMLTAVRQEDTPGMAGDATNSTMLTGKKKLGPQPM